MTPNTLHQWTHRGNQGGPHLLVTAGVHGDEFEPMGAVWRLHQLLPDLPLAGQVTLVPCVNEPACARRQRTAEDGLDLARTCPGDPRGTVTQQIADQLSQLIRTADYYIDLHTGGIGLEVYPLAGYVLHPRADILAIQQRMANAFGLPLVWGTDPNLPGRSLSVARDAGVPAIYTEYLGGAGSHRAAMEAYSRGCLRVMQELGMLPPDSLSNLLPLTPTTAVVVEDARPQSGHMQINHPAPRGGLFVPAVKLGDRVTAGQPLGQVIDFRADCADSVPAAQTGIVIVLRRLPRVDSGDSLGVVLETDEPLAAIDDWESLAGLRA